MVKHAWSLFVGAALLSLTASVIMPAQAAEVEVIRLGDEHTPKATPQAPPSQTWRLLKVLRAEVAAFQKDWPVARKMIREVSPWLEPGDGLYERLEAVRRQLPPEKRARPPATPAPANAPPQTGPPAVMVADFAGAVARGFPSDQFQLSKPFLVLLPLSGPYKAAGEAVLHELRQLPGFKPQDIIDTALFSHQELSQLIQSYQPQWLLGPMRPQVVESLLSVNPDLPMLALTNRCPRDAARCHPLIPSLKEQALHYLQNRQAAHPALIVVEEDFWQVLQPSIQTWLKQTQPYLVVITPRDSQLKLAALFNLKSATQRYHNLRWLLKRPLTPVLRMRQDISRVIVLGGVSTAYQTRTLLKFWRLPVQVKWLPTKLFEPDAFQRLLPVWPRTEALLFPFLLDKGASDDEVGIFHAIGKTTRLILSQPQTAVKAPLGILHPVGERNEYVLEVPWVLIDNGHFDIQQDNSWE